MKPSSLPEVCSIKSKKHSKLQFQPWLAHFSFPLLDAATFTTHSKDHNAAFQLKAASQDKPATMLLCLAILYFAYPKEAFQLPSSPGPKRRAGYLSE